MILNSASSSFKVIFVLAMLAGLSVGMLAQRKGGSTGNSPIGNSNPTLPSPPSSITQPVFISGKVLLDGGGPPPEPVVIERVCNGTARRQGYTDGKGTFQIQLDQNPGFQDATESTNSQDTFSSSRAVTQAQDSLKLQYQGCEIRAVLPGFLSSSVILRLQGNSWQYDLGTIFLKRLDNMPGTTISMTSMSAPRDAKQAYEKARKAFDADKFSEAEKQAGKAVKVYPNFAAAWSLLGDIHQQQKQIDLAIKEYSQALAADSRFVNPIFGLALIAAQQKRWQDAAELSDQVVKMNSMAFPSAYFYNAVANYNLGKIELAEASARKFKSLDTEHHHPDVCLLLGQMFIQRRDYAAAAQQMRDYLIFAPDSPHAGEVRQWLKHYEDSAAAKPPQ